MRVNLTNVKVVKLDWRKLIGKVSGVANITSFYSFKKSKKDYDAEYKYYVYIFFELYENKDSHFAGKLSDGSFIFLEGKPFYVGKGTEDRCLVHFNHLQRGKLKTPFYKKLKSVLNKNPNLIPKELVSIVKFFNTEEEAYEFEDFVISEIGSKFIDEIKDGPLMNMCLRARPPSRKNKTFKEIYGDRAKEVIEKINKTRRENGSRSRKWEYNLIDPNGNITHIPYNVSPMETCTQLGVNYEVLSNANRKNRILRNGPSKGWKLDRISRFN